MPSPPAIFRPSFAPPRRLPDDGRSILPARRSLGEGGFALLITITLLAFLVLLLVSLASLTRVETQVASNTQSISQARQNALMALNIAIGQLQKYTGPDQRVTAAADISSAADGTRLAATSLAQNTASANGTKNGLAPVSATASLQKGTRWWTGVWGRSGSAYSTPAKSIYEETPSPVLLNWLVSGNEDRDLSVDSGGLVKTSTSDGATSANTASFTPGSPVNWTAAGLDITAPSAWNAGSSYANLEIKTSGQKAVLLVGPRTAGTAVIGAETAVERYVVAPLKPIDTPASTVPGMGTSGNVTVGRYGWWVGDQGVKADYTLTDPNAAQNTPANNTTAGAQSRLRLMTPSHSGIELIPGFANYPTSDAATSTTIGRLLDMPLASMIDSSLAANNSEILRQNFHDFSVGSHGLLTDTANGGLRKDLTYYFEQSTLPSPLAGQNIIPSAYSPNWGAGGYAPKWDWLHSFYNTNPAVSSGSLKVRPETATETGVSPVITQFRLIVFTTDSTNLITNPKNGIPAAKTFNLPIRCNVAVVLANPYNTALNITAGDLEIVLKNNYNGSSSKEGLVVQAASGNGKGTVQGLYGILRASGATTPGGLLDTVKLSVPAMTIAPGQSVTLGIKGVHTINETANAPLDEPVNSVALTDCTSNAISSSDYIAGTNPLTFTTTDATSGIALYQYGTDLAITLRRPSDRANHQNIRHFAFLKGVNQLQSFTGSAALIVLGTGWTKFIAPGYRLMDWNDASVKQTFFSYTYGRPYQDYNIRAGTITHPATFFTNYGTSYGTYVLISPPSYGAGVIYSGAGGNAAGIAFSNFNDSLYAAPWAEDSNYTLRGASDQGVLFDFPRRASGQLPVLSLGQFQHANLSTNDQTTGGTIGFETGYAAGNSYSHPYVARGSTVQSRADLSGVGVSSSNSTRYFDMSYLLNTALWDGYFLSGIPQTSGDRTPQNPRYLNYTNNTSDTDMHSPDVAAYLLSKGAFNINSTSVNAWIALLGGLNKRVVNNDTGTTDGVPYPRTLWQPQNNALTGGSYQTSGTGEDAYAGYRRLNQNEITSLAAEIVKRVRARGPFVSLSHFINRTIVPASTAFNSSVNDADTSGNLASPTVPMGRGFSGPLQAAIDSSASGINTFIKVGGAQVTGDAAGAYGDRVLFNGEVASSTDYASNSANSRAPFFADKTVDAPSVNWDMTVKADPGATGRTSTAIPGWLLQADILQALAPSLSARSDTFVIRTYGDVVNPATGDVTGRAWCEAVVQRTATYTDGTAATATPASGSVAEKFGRSYKVVGFRWLSPNDI